MEVNRTGAGGFHTSAGLDNLATPYDKNTGLTNPWFVVRGVMHFFVYADSLNPTQLKRRAPEHAFVCPAYLPDHTIQFCRWSSQWRCGLASVAPSPGEQVWGVVLDITDEDLKSMDEFEGEVPQGAFRHLPVTVVKEDGEKMLVTTHAATPIGKFKPKENYLEWVIKGVKHWKLPDACLETWKSFMPR